MDPQTAFNIAVGAASIFGGWMLKSIYDAIRDLRTADESLHDRITRLAGEIPNMYVRRDDYINTARDIKDALIRIENKLDSKADK